MPVTWLPREKGTIGNEGKISNVGTVEPTSIGVEFYDGAEGGTWLVKT